MVQVMTYLVENEQAALVVPARFLGRIHPHFREVVQLLAVQVADEARHIEVFTRRALLGGGRMGTSAAGGRASLATLVAEPDFALASFLLSVLGEGSFLNLLAFLERHAPDPVTRQVSRLALQDEARHVAFGLAHLEHQAAADPSLRDRLRAAVERRHDALADTAGLNDEVFDALVVLAAGSWDAVRPGRGPPPGAATPGGHGRGPPTPPRPPRLPPGRGRRPVRPPHPQLHVAPEPPAHDTFGAPIDSCTGSVVIRAEIVARHFRHGTFVRRKCRAGRGDHGRPRGSRALAHP